MIFLQLIRMPTSVTPVACATCCAYAEGARSKNCSCSPAAAIVTVSIVLQEVETLFHEAGHCLQHMLTGEQNSLMNCFTPATIMSILRFVTCKDCVLL